MKVGKIINKINSFFQAVDAQLTRVIPMPAIFLLCAAFSRQGLSPLRSLSNVCKELEAAGIPTGPNPDGSPNLIVLASYAILKEVYRAQTEDAVVQGGIQPGEMMILSQGANSGGPVVSTGSNLLPTHLWGIIQ
jgi:hypothetical protein